MICVIENDFIKIISHQAIYKVSEEIEVFNKNYEYLFKMFIIPVLGSYFELKYSIRERSEEYITLVSQLVTEEFSSKVFIKIYEEDKLEITNKAKCIKLIKPIKLVSPCIILLLPQISEFEVINERDQVKINCKEKFELMFRILNKVFFNKIDTIKSELVAERCGNYIVIENIINFPCIRELVPESKFMSKLYVLLRFNSYDS